MKTRRRPSEGDESVNSVHTQSKVKEGDRDFGMKISWLGKNTLYGEKKIAESVCQRKKCY